MHVATLCGVFRTFFFLLSVSAMAAGKELNNLICGALGSTWGHNFWESVNSGLDYWNGLLDWTTGLTFDLKIAQRITFCMQSRYIQGSVK